MLVKTHHLHIIEYIVTDIVLWRHIYYDYYYDYYFKKSAMQRAGGSYCLPINPKTPDPQRQPIKKHRKSMRQKGYELLRPKNKPCPCSLNLSAFHSGTKKGTKGKRLNK